MYELAQKLLHSFTRDTNIGPVILQKFIVDNEVTEEEFNLIFTGLEIIKDKYDQESERRMQEQSAKGNKGYSDIISQAKKLS